MSAGRASTDALDQLHAALARSLKARLESGEATAADMNVIRAFLKDNGIEAVAVPGSPVAGLAAAAGKSVADGLPFAGDTSAQTYQ